MVFGHFVTLNLVSSFNVCLLFVVVDVTDLLVNGKLYGLYNIGGKLKVTS